MGSWLVTLVELAATMAAVVLAASLASDRRARVFWLVLAVVLAGFSLNKQLDAQTYLIELGHQVFAAPAYRGLRASALPITAVGMAAAFLCVMGVLVWGSHRWSRFRLALVGAMVLFVVALLRAADIIDPQAFPGHSGHVVALPVEALGAALVLVSAVRQRRIQASAARRHPRRTSTQSSLPT